MTDHEIHNEPYYECPQFEACSCNLCPLDPDMHLRVPLPEDEPCLSAIRTRLAIAQKHADTCFLFGGLTEKEHIRHKASLRMGGKGYVLAPVEDGV